MFAECTIQYDTKKGEDIYVFVEKQILVFGCFSLYSYITGRISIKVDEYLLHMLGYKTPNF